MMTAAESERPKRAKLPDLMEIQGSRGVCSDGRGEPVV